MSLAKYFLCLYSDREHKHVKDLTDEAEYLAPIDVHVHAADDVLPAVLLEALDSQPGHRQ